MSDITSADLVRTRTAAAGIARAGTSAATAAGSIRTTLTGVDLPDHAAVLVGEIADELGALERFLTAVSDGVEHADQSGAALFGWRTPPQSGLAQAESDLLTALFDGVGAEPPEPGGEFVLSESIVSIPGAQWAQATLLPGCEAYPEGFGYTGGGAVVGPDGRVYPIVIPNYPTDDRIYTVDGFLSPGMESAASLGGHDPGWVVVDYRTGVEQFEHVPWYQQWVIAGAVATGLSAPATVDDAYLDGIHMGLGSQPFYDEDIPVSPGVSQSAAEASQDLDTTVTLWVDGHAMPYSVADIGDQNRAVRRAAERLGVTPASSAQLNMGANVFGLGISAFQGVTYAMSMNNSGGRAYEVIFEENADGRVRARVQTFDLSPGTDGAVLSAWHMFVDEDGDLVQSPASYQTGPMIMSSDAVLAYNPYDTDFVTSMPNPAFDVGTPP